MCDVQALKYIYHLRIIWWVEDQHDETSRISISAGGQGLMGEKQRETWKMRVHGLPEVTMLRVVVMCIAKSQLQGDHSGLRGFKYRVFP